MATKRNVIIKVSKMTCPRGGEMLQLAAKGRVELPIVVMKNAIGKFLAYAESVSDENCIGMVLTVDGEAAEDLHFCGQTYEMRITGIGDLPTLLTAEMVSEKETVAVKTGEESKELRDAWDKAIADGVCTKDDREYLIWHWDNNQINQYDRFRAVSGFRKYYDKRGERIMPIRPSHAYVNSDPKHQETPYDLSVYGELFNMALNRQPVVCEGDKSTGKSVAAKNVAYDLMMPSYEDTYGEDMMKLDPIAERAFSEEAQEHMTRELAEAYMRYQSGQEEFFSQAMEYMYWKDRAMTPQLATNLGEMGKWAFSGGVYIANEANLARVNVRESIFNPAAEDNQPHLTIPGYGIVYLNKDCVMIATQNKDYAGTNGSNDAIDSRFGKIKFGYPPHIFDQLKTMTESDIGDGCLQDEYYKRCDKLYVFLRDQVHAGERSNGVLSIRSFGKALKDVALGGGYVTLHSKLLIYLQNMVHTEEDEKAIADDIHTYIGNI